MRYQKIKILTTTSRDIKGNASLPHTSRTLHPEHPGHFKARNRPRRGKNGKYYLKIF